MTRLSWGDTGARLFEAGVDRGVLFTEGNPGVPWNGLKAIRENPSGGGATGYYLDGVKYLNVAAVEEFNATLEAYSAPDEFAVCDGTSLLYAGLFATQQPRKPFNFSYRTRVGNDVESTDYGYKLHLIFNALAAPSSHDNASLSNSVSPMALSWAITTTPVWFPEIRPTSHIIIDSNKSGPDLMAALEDFLYGSDNVDAAFPTPEELHDLFSEYGHLQIRDLGEGEYMARGLPVQIDGPATFTIDYPTVIDNGDQSFTINY